MVTRDDLEGSSVYEKGSCLYCGGSGYSGRIPVFEVLKINDSIKSLIHKDLNDDNLEVK